MDIVYCDLSKVALSIIMSLWKRWINVASLGFQLVKQLHPRDEWSCDILKLSTSLDFSELYFYTAPVIINNLNFAHRNKIERFTSAAAKKTRQY